MFHVNISGSWILEVGVNYQWDDNWARDGMSYFQHIYKIFYIKRKILKRIFWKMIMCKTLSKQANFSILILWELDQRSPEKPKQQLASLVVAAFCRIRARAESRSNNPQDQELKQVQRPHCCRQWLLRCSPQRGNHVLRRRRDVGRAGRVRRSGILPVRWE